jgi:hypothetical protein
MLEECVLTPIPNDSQRSSVSLLVIPSSLASSCTRFFAAKFLDQSFEVVLLGARCGEVVTPRPSILARTRGSARFSAVEVPAVSWVLAARSGGARHSARILG